MAAEVYKAQGVPVLAGPPALIKDMTTNVVPSGTQSARTEWIIITAVNAYGESANSPEYAVAVPANNVLTITHPFQVEENSPGGPTGWNCYITTAGPGKETKQNTTLLALGTTFQEPATGLIAGIAVPNNAAAIPSYGINPAGVINTPPATGNITVAQDPAGTSVTNTGRTQGATAVFMSTSLNALNAGTTPGKAKN